MIDSRVWRDVENRMLGETGAQRNVTDLEREIRSVLSSLETLYRRLQDAKNGASRRRAPQDVVNELNDLYPYLEVVQDSQNGLPGTDVGFVIKVQDAPFHIFDMSGTALHTTLPANRMSIYVSQRGITSFVIDGSRWNELAHLVENDNRFMLNSMYGHPHCSEKLWDMADSMVTDYGTMCFGYGNDRLELSSQVNSQPNMVLCVKGLYAWLTEINVNSMFHTSTSPIILSDSTRNALVPVCREAASSLRDFVRGQTYTRYITSIRTQAFDEDAAVSLIIGGMSALMDDRFKGTLVQEQVRRLIDSQGTGSRGERLRVSLGMHQLISDVLILGSRISTSGGNLLRNSAEAGMAVLGHVWAQVFTSNRLGNGLGEMAYPEVKRYVADWEAMKGGRYGRTD